MIIGKLSRKSLAGCEIRGPYDYGVVGLRVSCYPDLQLPERPRSDPQETVSPYRLEFYSVEGRSSGALSDLPDAALVSDFTGSIFADSTRGVSTRADTSVRSM